MNQPLRETNGFLIYAIGTAPVDKINTYFRDQGGHAVAKPNAGDPTRGTVRIAYYDTQTSAGPFRSLAATIVTESGVPPAAFHYAMYFANENYNQQYGIYQIGVD